ncbi:DUF1284 domain-containing protein [Anaerosalibacter sp. Marseille-P3206]|uniref:DUF1284 domain-containing protein n=1 Tax=Anaerosalibacter sp. Marseille-P3206 TaxID=1871005 RepID=UPI00098764D1|nr:DUF1284 domain-containing protein [Anaerosalibacter sp. Marseille-P3206]
MILILNCLLEEKSVNDFNKAMKKHLGNLPINYEIIRVREAGKIANLNVYSHLIISGSGASPAEDNPWNSDLEKIIKHFVNNKKPILGICYGHQFLVRVLAGVDHVRKAEKGEIGFASIDIDDNEIFNGIVDPVFSVAHYEEVFDLNEDFKIIARNKNCAVHAFQYKNLPIWGTQFHPEYGPEDTRANINEYREKDPDFEKYYIYDLEDEKKTIQNKLIFDNFISSNKICLRPHHLMCIQSYIGKGYSEEFVKNMDIVVGSLRENKDQIIRLVEGNDHVCSHCPHNIDGRKCESDEKVVTMDRKVLKYLEITPGEYSYSQLFNRLKEKLTDEAFRDICGDCEWYELCH